MSNDVNIRVTGTNTSGASVNTAKRSLADLGDEAKRTKTRVVDLAVAEQLTERSSKELARGLDEAGDQSSQLTRKLLETAAATKALSHEFSRTGDADTLGKLQLVQAEFAKLKNVAKNIEVGEGKKQTNLFESLVGKGLLPAAAKAGVESASTFSAAFEGGIMNAFKALPPEAQAAIGASIGAAVVVAMPGIVALINGAILTGIGGGGLAAGIMIAAKDPQVANAFKGLGANIMSELTEAAKPFRSELIATADIFGDAFADAAPQIKSMFATLSTAVQPIARGLAAAFSNALPGLEKAVRASLPVLMQFANELPRLGKVAGQMFDAIAQAGPGAELAIKFVLVQVEALIKAFTWLTQSLGPVANGVAALVTGTHELFGSIGDGNEKLQATGVKLDDVSSAADRTTTSFHDTSVSVDRTKKLLDSLNRAFNDFFDVAMRGADANIQVQAALDDLTSSFKENGRTIDDNTEKGRANHRAVLDTVKALEEQREAAIDAGGGTKEAYDKATAAYNKQLHNLEAMLVKLGLSKQAAHDLLAQFYDKTFTITARVKVVQTGPVSAQGVISTGDLRRATGSAYAHGGIVGAAAGGMRGDWTWTGEEGAELVKLPPGSQVYSHGQSMQMAGQGGGGGPVQVLMQVVGNSGDWLVAIINQFLAEGKIMVTQKMLRAY